MVFSHGGSAAGAWSDIAAPHRTRAARTAKFEPYPASTSRDRGSEPQKLPDKLAQTGLLGKRLKRSGATDDQISAQLRNPDGKFKTITATASIMRASGWQIGEARISTLLRKERDHEDEMH